MTRFQVLTTSAIEWASAQGLPVGNEIISDLINPSGVVNFVGETFGRALGLLATTFLVFLITIFLLSEATVFPAKFRAILGRKQGDPRRLTKIVREVQEYLGIKTLISLATGLLLGLWTWMMGLDFPVLLGLVAFLLNYVPTIGSVLASFPAMLLALVQVGIGHSFVVMLGYAAVNLVFGNFLEPSLMGRRLGLSTLVVIFSLIFWAWVWGPVGALLAVPLTMVVRIMLENTPDLRWVVILLDKSPPQQVLAEDKRGRRRTPMPRVPFGDLPGSARVWIFASARRLDSPERERLLSSVDGFLDGWAAHGVPLTGARELRFARFLVVGVDEFAAPPSGCSIDALVRVFKVLEREFGMGLLDRAPVWYRGGKGDDEIECVSRRRVPCASTGGRGRGGHGGLRQHRHPDGFVQEWGVGEARRRLLAR